MESYCPLPLPRDELRGSYYPDCPPSPPLYTPLCIPEEWIETLLSLSLSISIFPDK